MEKLLVLSVLTLLALSVEEGYEFECYDITNTMEMQGRTFNGGRACCGIAANGKRRCGRENEWNIYQGHARFCNIYEDAQQAFNNHHDLCCDSPLIDNCGACKSFHVWDFESVEDMVNQHPVESWINNTDWRDDYYDGELLDPLSRDIYPAGYINAILRDQNKPPVCVYVRNSGGHVIEVKIEPESEGSTVCIGDSLDDQADKTNPGFTTTCDAAQLTTCIQDGTLKTTFQFPRNANGNNIETRNEARGFTFQITCQHGCLEQDDLPLWLRVRWSTKGYEDQVETNAFENPEMFCEYVNRDYPEWDLFPTDIELVTQAIGEDAPSSSSTLSFFVTLLAVACFLI